MLAWQADTFGEPLDVLTLKDIEKPVPGPGEVLIKVRAVGLGLPDLRSVQGRYPFVKSPPAIPGHSFCGTIAQVGPGSTLSPGTRVMARTLYESHAGALAEYALAKEFHTFAAPDELDDIQAAAFVLSYHTAYVGLVSRARLAEGETLLVLGGSGATGSAAIELGKALGAKVIAAARGKAKIDFCRAQGADHVIDTTRANIGESLRELTGGHGADVIFDPVGGEPSDQAVEGIAFGGRLVLVGNAAGLPNLNPLDMIGRTYAAMGAAFPNRTEAEREEAIRDLDAMVRDGRLTVPVEGCHAFDAAPKVIARFAGDTMGMQVITV
ncbi:quinone oxidoreductase family protein [Croceicoccus sediminis]|uniref:quinone oxidoreductase family protein n=1 Tax=Croceicoccus sediminis TaxID=2571150 RepID=UPI001183757F|nr:NADPH:quinone oxidoreductase family protein [Croceicoccus sediminis]